MRRSQHLEGGWQLWQLPCRRRGGTHQHTFFCGWGWFSDWCWAGFFRRRSRLLGKWFLWLKQRIQWMLNDKSRSPSAALPIKETTFNEEKPSSAAKMWSLRREIPPTDRCRRRRWNQGSPGKESKCWNTGEKKVKQIEEKTERKRMSPLGRFC